MRIILGKSWRLLKNSLLTLIILTGVLVCIGQIASPFLETFKPEIETATSELLGSQVKIGSIKSRWRTFGPMLEMQQIEISERADHHSSLSLERIDADLSIIDMLTKGSLTPTRLTMHGIQIEVSRSHDGRIRVSGFTPDDTEQENAVSVDPLFRIPRLELQNSSISWHDATGQSANLNLQDINLLFRNDNQHDRHQLDLQVLIPGAKTQSLKIAADIRARLDNLANWSGTVYIEADDLNLQPLTGNNLPSHFLITQGYLSSRSWLQAEQGKITHARGDLNVDQLLLSSTRNGGSQQLRLATKFDWQRTTHSPSDWQLTLGDSRIDNPQQTLINGGLSLSKQATRSKLWIENTNLQAIHALRLLLPDEQQQQIPTLITSGSASDLLISIDHQTDNWFIESQINGLNLATVDDPGKAIQLPSITNLNAKLMASSNGGLAQLDGSQMLYSHKGLFRDTIPIDHLKGDLRWHSSPDKPWQISTSSLQLNTPDLETETRLSLVFDEQLGPVIDLQMDFGNADNPNASLYYPAGILEPELVDWMDGAIASGKVNSGSFVLYGAIKDFPFEPSHNGHFEVLFNVEHGILDYQPGWPRLEELSAEIRFLNDALYINAYEGKIYNTDILKARAYIPNLSNAAVIDITGSTRGPAADNMRLLAETDSLKADFQGLTDNVKLNGQTRLDLAFSIPLEDHVDYALDGKVHFDNNTLQLPDWQFEITDTRGALNFNLNGVSSDNLRGKLMGSPFNAKVKPDSNGNTQVSAPVTLSVNQIRRIYPELQTGLLAGQATWQVNVTIPSVEAQSSGPVELTLQSDLDGIGLLLPEPMYKPLKGKQNLKISTRFDDTGIQPLTLQVGNKLQSALLLSANSQTTSIDAAHFHFGDNAIRVAPPAEGVLITGTLGDINLQHWLDWLETRPKNEQKMPPVKIDLKVDSLDFASQRLTNLILNGETRNSNLAGTLSSDKLEGRFEVIGNDPIHTLNLELDKARLSLNLDALDEQTSVGKTINAFDPAASPDLNITIEHLFINNHDFGKTVFRSTRGKNSMRLDEFRTTTDLLRMQASGLWLEENQQQKSLLDMNLDSSNLGLALEKLGYTKQLDKGQAHIEANLSWPGGPPEFSQENLSGKLSMDIKKGRVMEFDPGVGRVLGVLNLSAIQRRLTLDFSDLFEEGFTFDDITANFVMDNGDAYTNDLVINSTAGTVNVSGRIGLRHRDYDQLVSITPSIQSGLTIAGAVAGGPAGAAIGYLAQKLIGDKVDDAARTRYSITGSWDAPEVKEFEKKNKLRDDEQKNQ